jgi:hypothetical protein
MKTSKHYAIVSMHYSHPLIETKEVKKKKKDVSIYFQNTDHFPASIYFYHTIEQIIKAVAYQERYGLADIVTLLNNGTTTSIPSVSFFALCPRRVTHFFIEIFYLSMAGP